VWSHICTPPARPPSSAPYPCPFLSFSLLLLLPLPLSLFLDPHLPHLPLTHPPTPLVRAAADACGGVGPAAASGRGRRRWRTAGVCAGVCGERALAPAHEVQSAPLRSLPLLPLWSLGLPLLPITTYKHKYKHACTRTDEGLLVGVRVDAPAPSPSPSRPHPSPARHLLSFPLLSAWVPLTRAARVRSRLQTQKRQLTRHHSVLLDAPELGLSVRHQTDKWGRDRKLHLKLWSRLVHRSNF
jgi:hypothetical protein